MRQSISVEEFGTNYLGGNVSLGWIARNHFFFFLFSPDARSVINRQRFGNGVTADNFSDVVLLLGSSCLV